MYIPSATSTVYADRVNAGGGSKTSTKLTTKVVSVNLLSDPPSCFSGQSEQEHNVYGMHYLCSDYEGIGGANIVVQDIAYSNHTTARVNSEGSFKLYNKLSSNHTYDKCNDRKQSRMHKFFYTLFVLSQHLIKWRYLSNKDTFYRSQK